MGIVIHPVSVLIIRLVNSYQNIKKGLKKFGDASMEEEDPYTVLQVKRKADLTEIRKSYQRLARQVKSYLDWL